MKDLYSFTKTQEETDVFYEKAIGAYNKVFERLGLKDITYLTVASGGSFGTQYSHEFQTLTEAGEDVIHIDESKKLAVNKEVLNDETLKHFGIGENLVAKKSVEVGNIYKLGDFYSKPLELNFTDADGQKKPVMMGSYGIGVSRLMGVIAEIFSQDSEMVWPESVAPFKVHLVDLSNGDEDVKKSAEEFYEKLKLANIEVLFDDRDARAGEKFADSDLIGIPVRFVDRGLIWPKDVSPFAVHLVRLGNNESTLAYADKIYEDLKNKGIEVLYDDRDLRPGEKFDSKTIFKFTTE
jgi:prolyl-tRNA synthetase